MIILIRNRTSPLADRIEARLRDLVVSHQVVVAETEPSISGIPPQLPAIRHSSGIVTGEDNLQAYLVQLEQLVADWNRFQSDSCYLDDDGEPC